MFVHRSASLFLVVWIFLLSLVSFDTTDEFSVSVKKITSRTVPHELTARLSIFNLFKLNELWPYYKNHVNQIFCLASWISETFVRILLIANLSLNQTLLTFLLCVRQTWMTQLILVISLWEVIPLIRKHSSTHMHGLAVYVKEGLYFGTSSRDLSLENSPDSYLYFQLALLDWVSSFFFLYRLPSSLCTVFDSISSNIDEVLSINPFANISVFGDFNVRHKDWLAYSGGTD